MGNGIIIKIWNIKAQPNGKSATAQINDSIKYITNKEKCKLSLPGSSEEGQKSNVQQGSTSAQIERELKYVVNDIKTMEGLYTGGINILDVSRATDEMMQIKEFYHKTDGRVALHGIISLPKEESDPANAGKLIMLLNDLMREIYPEHQVVHAVHTNTENLHIHFIVNTVSLDGRKIHMDQKFMRTVMEPAVNRLAKKYGFTPNEAWMIEARKDIYPIAERKMMIRKDIDLAIELSGDYEEFLFNLRKKGYTANNGTVLYLKNEEMAKGMPTYVLGPNYSVDAIVDRIATKHMPLKQIKASQVVRTQPHLEMVNYVPIVLKKYKDMKPDEKIRVVNQLKLGKNPWRSQYSTNWRIAGASKELDQIASVTDIIAAYGGNDLYDTKQKLIALQKQLAEEKKEIRALSRKYKPQIDLYKEMQKHARAAYLYETSGCMEYAEDYKAYKELQERLMRGYAKEPAQIAAFMENQQSQLLYIQAQKQELSDQYKVLDKYEKKQARGIEQNSHLSIFQAVGHTEAKLQAVKYHILTTKNSIVTSDTNPDYRLKVLTTPDYINGKATITTMVSVITKDGEILEQFDSKALQGKAFNDKLYQVRNEYGFKSCKVHSDTRSR